jgi:hypothetical protein
VAADRAGEHIARFNAAVRSGDWADFVARFADDAVLEFVNVPTGPFRGRAQIAAAYRDNPPDDTIAVRSVESADHTERITFDWTRGGSGILVIEWRPDTLIERMTVEFT